MKRCSLSVTAFVLVLSAAAPRAAHADEFKLKDGSTIVGTVVGYEGNSFKVKTSYGFALVEKDKIVSIKIASAPASSPAKADKDAAKPATEKPTIRATKAAEEHASAATGKTPVSAQPAEKSKAEVASTKPSSAATNSSVGAASPSAAQPASPATPGPQPVSAPATASSATPQAADATADASSTPPGPQPIREKISGNTYINDTYEFEMYKPPDWQVMDGARSVLPGAVAAMGTDDQSTYLVVGQQPAGKSAAADNAAMEQRLNEILVNYRPIGDEHLTVSGEPVVAHRFRGSVDEHDWSGFMVFMPHGEKLYTIFGMTRADDDLVQIQENVIRRTIASFQFLP
jgi:hypothetical protein